MPTRTEVTKIVQRQDSDTGSILTNLRIMMISPLQYHVILVKCCASLSPLDTRCRYNVYKTSILCRRRIVRNKRAITSLSLT